MNLSPSHRELWERVETADDTACNGWGDWDCPFCQAVVEALRGGSVHCPDCGHINAIGHSCSDWREYDARAIDNAEVGRRWRERDNARWAGTSNEVEVAIRMSGRT